MPFEIRSAVDPRMLTLKQTSSPYFEYHPRVLGQVLNPGVVLTVQDETFESNKGMLRRLEADTLISIKDLTVPKAEKPAPAPVLEKVAVTVPTEAPPEVAAAAEAEVAKEFEQAVAATEPAPVEPEPTPVVEEPATKKKGRK